MRRATLFSWIGQSLLIFCATTATGSVALGQSTQGTLLVIVKDTSGAVMQGADVKITNLEEGTARTYQTNELGSYHAPDLKPGAYRIEVRKEGFKTAILDRVELSAREERRQDIELEVGGREDTVEVRETPAALINTEAANIAASFDSKTVFELPINFRASFSGTSPLPLAQSLPGAQADSDGKISVQGGLPFMSETSVDGISTQSTGDNNPLRNAWPSVESIHELRIDGVNNSAEFGQPGAITSITKHGTNNYHGAAFGYYHDSAFDAIGFTRETNPAKPDLRGRDYGVSVGGPVRLGGYDGRNRTFFFGTFESYRLPNSTPVSGTVPTEAMRNGDFSQVFALNSETGQYDRISPLDNPFTGKSYGFAIPGSSISPVAKRLLSLFPAPNVGNTSVFNGETNYAIKKTQNSKSDQFDIRMDHDVGTKLQVFGRFSWKNIDQTNPSPSVFLIPDSANVDHYRMFVAAATYNFSSNLLNEFRFGFTHNTNGNTNPFDGPGFAGSLGLPAIGQNNLFYNGITEVDLAGMSSLNVDRLLSVVNSRTEEYTDTVSWIKGRHSTKFGLDIRSIGIVSPLGFYGADNYGTFDFQSGLFTGNSFADFLLGLPTTTYFDTVRHNNDGSTNYYNFYGQDSWQATKRLTLDFGLRYEFHPGYKDASGQIGNFDPSVPKSGVAIYPDGAAALLDPGFLASFDACPNLTGSGPAINGAPCTKVLSASEAHLPNSLRTADKLRFVPRAGIAYRPFHNDKTVFRGGYGMYNVTTLGSIFYALTGTLQAGTQVYNNQLTVGGPAFQWPNIKAGSGTSYSQGDYGTAYFGTANSIHFHDPRSQQWNITIEHELRGSLGVRASYIGMHTNDLVWAPNYNDLPYSKTTAAIDQPLSARPFPNWGTLNTRDSSATATYNSLQLGATGRFRGDLSFDSTYTYAYHNANNLAHQQSFADENGGSRATYYFDKNIDYGAVYGTRRHRWITTSVFALPMGKDHLKNALGGWSFSTILLWQSGPFLTPYFDGGDPSGTGSGTLSGRSQYPDLAGNPVPGVQNADQWINPAAYVCPGVTGWVTGMPCNIGSGSGTPNPIGRFGTSRPGSVNGPGIFNLSTGIRKQFAIGEQVKASLGLSFTNVLNHTNLGDPNTDITSGNFGRIDGYRTSDYAGPRTGQISLRVEF